MKVQWNDFDNYTQKLISKVLESSYLPEIIVGVGISGLIPAAMVAKALAIKEIKIITIESYTGDNNKLPPSLISDTFSSALKGRRVLVVDDIVATGETFHLIRERLAFFEPAEIKFAASVVSEYVCKNYPDYWGESIMRAPNDFIILPWDKEPNS